MNPPLVITPSQANVIVLDFDLQRMLGTDSTGNITGKITPVVNITQLIATSRRRAPPTPMVLVNWMTCGGLCGKFQHQQHLQCQLHWETFEMQLLSPSMADAPRDTPIKFTSTTTKIGFSDLRHLLPNSYVEADVILDPPGELGGKDGGSSGRWRTPSRPIRRDRQHGPDRPHLSHSDRFRRQSQAAESVGP